MDEFEEGEMIEVAKEVEQLSFIFKAEIGTRDNESKQS
jgi:hypothetical protein